jgi:hypothetical protein
LASGIPGSISSLDLDTLVSDANGSNVQQPPSAPAHYDAPVRYVIEKILQDAQERLAFRAQEYIRQEIKGFKPREQEIDLLARSKKCMIVHHLSIEKVESSLTFFLVIYI